MIRSRLLATLLLGLLAQTSLAQPDTVTGTAPAAGGPVFNGPAVPGAVAATDPLATDALGLPLSSVSITLNGRTTVVDMEDPTNPLVLIQTTRGDMVIELFPAEAPLTVQNFLALADGSKPFFDTNSGVEVQRPFYDGLMFHRVIAGFIIQAGSPTGGGDGGPGFTVPDEINATSLGLDQMPLIDSEGYPHPLLGIADQAAFQQTILKPLYAAMGVRSDADIAQRSIDIESRLRGMSLKAFYELLGYRYMETGLSRAPLRGMLAMASSGPGTAGSQFFLTLADAPWLAGRHTVFGKLRAGQAVLDLIGRMPVDALQQPLEPVSILQIRRIPL
jgi:peptidyl-prolyl cis-trans isomerase A (cyclophilin A)